MAETIITPVGRIVQGSLFQRITKDMKGNQLSFKDGEVRSTVYVGLAIAKNHGGHRDLMELIQSEARLLWPQGQTTGQKFGWKMYDGDSPEFVTREGFPGHTVLRLTTNFNLAVYAQDGKTIITDPKAIKCGDYIDTVISIASNRDTKQPGLFLNIHAARLVGYGEEIIAVDYSKHFQTPPQMPQGASPAPVPNAPMPPPPPTQAKRMTAKAGGVSYEAFVAQGWTDEALRTEGYLE